MSTSVFFKKVRPADFIFIGFVIAASVVQFSFHPNTYSAKVLLPYYIIAVIYLTVIFILPVDSEHRAVVFIKDWQPLITAVTTFFALAPLVNNGNPNLFDDRLIHADYLLFGTQPSFVLQHYLYPPLVDISQFFYTFFYFLPVVVGGIIYAKYDKTDFEKVSLMILMTFYVSFIGYMVFPAIGPRFTLAKQYIVNIKGAWIGNQLIDFISYLEGPMKKNCFPSQHTGGSLISIAVLYRYNKKLFYSFLIWPVMIIFATVYLRYHYVTDLIAGAVSATVAFWVSPYLVNLWNALADESKAMSEKILSFRKI